jgi:hypothetical protein
LKHQAIKRQIVILGILTYISRAASGSSILPHDIGLAGVAEPFPGLALLEATVQGVISSLLKDRRHKQRIK